MKRINPEITAWRPVPPCLIMIPHPGRGRCFMQSAQSSPPILPRNGKMVRSLMPMLGNRSGAIPATK